MGSKLIFLLWLIVGSLLTFFCLNKDKRDLLLSYKNSYLKGDNISTMPQESKEVFTVIEEGDSPKVQQDRNNTIEINSSMVLESNNSSMVEDKDDAMEKKNREKKVKEERKQLVETKDIVSHILKETPILFKTNSSELHSESHKGLDKIFSALKKLPPQTLVTIAGHTDATGDAPSNKKLSQKRANAVMFYLKKAGLNHLVLKAKGYGEERPLVSNQNDPENRRVEIVIERGE